MPALYLADQAALSLLATGHDTGLVLDSGHTHTRAVPVYQGHALEYATLSLNVTGQTIGEYIKQDINTKDCTEQVIKDIKESICKVDCAPEPVIGTPPSRYDLPDGTPLEVEDESAYPEVMFHPNIRGIDSEGVHRILIDRYI